MDLFHCNDSREGLDFTTTMQSFGLFPLINRATRVGKTRASLLDHIWTNSIERYVRSGVVLTDVSDHYLTFALFDEGQATDNNRDSHVLTSTHIFYESGWQTLFSLLSSTDWNLVKNKINMNEKYDCLHGILYSNFDKNYPVTVKKVIKIDILKPCKTNDLKDLIVERRNLLKLYKKNGQLPMGAGISLSIIMEIGALKTPRNVFFFFKQSTC